LLQALPDLSSAEALVPIGAILPTVVEALLDRMDDPSNYEVCEACHRPSWGFARWMAEEAVRDERARVAWEEFAAGEELSARERLTAVEHARALLAPTPKAARFRFLEVVR
jgi:hypothetical protein